MVIKSGDKVQLILKISLSGKQSTFLVAFVFVKNILIWIQFKSYLMKTREDLYLLKNT